MPLPTRLNARLETVTTTMTTAATNRNPMIDKPRCRVRICIPVSPCCLSYAAANPLEREAGDCLYDDDHGCHEQEPHDRQAALPRSHLHPCFSLLLIVCRCQPA